MTRTATISVRSETRGVVIGRDAAAVIDTGGSPEFGRRLRAGIAALTDLTVAWVIPTHAHPDHFF